MLRIDGAAGGGAVLRTALGLSIATDSAFEITNIRKTRPDPGLKAQHLAAVKAAAQCANADVDGAIQGSTKLSFEPHDMTEDRIRVTVPTAGAVGLVLQPLQIAAATGNRIRITVDGGATAGKWEPPVPYLQQIGTPVLDASGLSQDITIKQHGFYPEGGALVRATFSGKLGKLELAELGELIDLGGVSYATGHLEDAEVAERQQQAARRRIAQRFPSADIDIAAETVHTRSPGSVIVLRAGFRNTVIGADTLGEKGKRAEVVGQEAAEALLAQIDSGAAVDEWMADQLVPFLGLSGGAVKIPRLTDHINANRTVVEQFCGARIRFENQILRG